MRKGGLLGFALFLLVLFIVGLVGLTLLGLGFLSFHHLCNCHCESSLIEAGEVREIGTYNASIVKIARIYGRLVVEGGNSSPVAIYSNLPINVSQKGDKVIILCKECSKYRNGEIIIRGNLSELELGDVLGKIEIRTPLKILKTEDILGEVETYSPVEIFESDDIMGKVIIKVVGRVEVGDILGELKVIVPSGYGVNLEIDEVLGKVRNKAKGEKKIDIKISDVIGRVEVVND
ncbi:hypothetical protein [Pyrococcus horikoshii]|nr:hypothetical protein [Pyrococcus horikoshii]HII60670.1 hypothetical protein [Pyrococcus horikoshii]